MQLLRAGKHPSTQDAARKMNNQVAMFQVGIVIVTIYATSLTIVAAMCQKYLLVTLVWLITPDFLVLM